MIYILIGLGLVGWFSYYVYYFWDHACCGNCEHIFDLTGATPTIKDGKEYDYIDLVCNERGTPDKKFVIKSNHDICNQWSNAKICYFGASSKKKRDIKEMKSGVWKCFGVTPFSRRITMMSDNPELYKELDRFGIM